VLLSDGRARAALVAGSRRLRCDVTRRRDPELWREVTRVMVGPTGIVERFAERVRRPADDSLGRYGDVDGVSSAVGIILSRIDVARREL